MNNFQFQTQSKGIQEREKASIYWQDLHRNLRDAGKWDSSYKIVCFPGLSGVYNKMIHHFQQLSLRHALKYLHGIKGKAVLEVGCGTGRWCKFLSKLTDSVTGIDISEETVNVNRKLYPNIEFFRMRAQALDFPDAKFDIIFSITVLQHIPYEEKVAAIRQISRCLKPGGFVVIFEQIRPEKAHTVDFKDTITFPYTVREWKGYFEEFGCQLLWSERTLFLPLTDNIFFPAKKIIAKAFKKKADSSVKNNNHTRNIDTKINYIVTLLLLPLAFVAEYFFIYILGAAMWTKQDTFGRHQMFIFKKK